MKKLKDILIALMLIYLGMMNIINLYHLQRYKKLTDELIIQTQESQRIAREALDLLEYAK